MLTRMIQTRGMIFLTLVLLLAVSSGAGSSGQAKPRADGHRRFAIEEFNRALGVECAHCHVPDRWADEEKPAKATARQMMEMVELFNGKLLRGIGEVRCWTCHGGQIQPARQPMDAVDAQIAKWPESIANAPQPVKLTMAVFSAATGLRCAQCHDPTDWKRVATDRMRMVPRMARLFPAMKPFMPASANTQCYMCHKGTNKPEKDPPRGR